MKKIQFIILLSFFVFMFSHQVQAFPCSAEVYCNCKCNSGYIDTFDSEMEYVPGNCPNPAFPECDTICKVKTPNDAAQICFDLYAEDCKRLCQKKKSSMWGFHITGEKDLFVISAPKSNFE